ncbi:hypothetical protein SBRY_40191 [Actinacidiphila bryophytorum]|uniref:Uncharacterized protein n=1 Tax=Actinacidiphila bryophytorum TaxID=1436133 RepID=A0A9W4MHZ9_9ACTN|nr:hypothetical protein SBRY_40191 [Actinacidiphila bryophytorum]
MDAGERPHQHPPRAGRLRVGLLGRPGRLGTRPPGRRAVRRGPGNRGHPPDRMAAHLPGLLRLRQPGPAQDPGGPRLTRTAASAARDVSSRAAATGNRSFGLTFRSAVLSDR